MEKILVLEDEVDIGNLVAFNLRRNGYDVEVEHDGREGLGRILKDQPDLVTLDLMKYMPAFSWEFLQKSTASLRTSPLLLGGRRCSRAYDFQLL